MLKIRCDAANQTGMHLGCVHSPTAECACRRCSREPAVDRFHACNIHRLNGNVEKHHSRVYGKACVWIGIVPDVDPMPQIKAPTHPPTTPASDDWGGAKQW